MARTGAVLLAIVLLGSGSASAQFLQDERDRTAGRVATERARSDFRAAGRDEAVGDYGQAERDRAAGRIARDRADRDVLAADRDRDAAERARLLGR